MRYYFLLFSYLTLSIGEAQDITIKDLINICGKDRWEDVNSFLVNKGWEFYDSRAGSSERYNTITWSYNKSQYDDKATGWFYLYAYDSYPSKIEYTVFNKEDYNRIISNLASTGFTVINSQINDGSILSKYSNSSYILDIVTLQRERSDYDDSKIIEYEFTLLEKGGVYDKDNGNKKEFWDNGNLMTEYSLKNGKLEGVVRSYYEDGSIARTGHYKNNIENGNFIDYDEEGNRVEYYMKNGEIEGKAVSNVDGRIDKESWYVRGLKNGTEKGFLYNEDGIIGVVQSEYSNNKKNGLEIFIIKEDNKDRVVKRVNYVHGIKSGPFMEIEGDSLIFGTYKDGMLDGAYKVYIDMLRGIVGGIIRTDTTQLNLTTQGYYKNGYKTGYWRNYFVKELVSEGRYENDLREGEWKFYYPNYVDTKSGQSLPYARELYLITNYVRGKLNGISKRFSYLEDEKYPCEEIDKKLNNGDSCTRKMYNKISETSHYKNDELHGPYELKDSANYTIAKGTYNYGDRDKEWVYERLFQDNGSNYKYFERGNYINDKRDGVWVEYVDEDHLIRSRNFSKGDLDGEFIEFNSEGRFDEVKIFESNSLIQLKKYDSTGEKLIRKYDFSYGDFSGYKCKRTQYFPESTIIQEYYIEGFERPNHWLFDAIFEINMRLPSVYPNGIYEFLDSSNRIKIKGEYFKETKKGLWTHYYYNSESSQNDQGIKVEINRNSENSNIEVYKTIDSDLNWSGKFIERAKDGYIQEIRKVKNGVRHGSTIIYDGKGNVVGKEKYRNGSKL